MERKRKLTITINSDGKDVGIETGKNTLTEQETIAWLIYLLPELIGFTMFWAWYDAEMEEKAILDITKAFKLWVKKSNGLKWQKGTE